MFLGNMALPLETPSGYDLSMAVIEDVSCVAKTGDMEEMKTGIWRASPAEYSSTLPALGRHRLVDLCEFKANTVYRVSSRSARAT